MFALDVKHFRLFGTARLEGETFRWRAYALALLVPVCVQTASCLADTYLSLGDVNRMTDNVSIALTFVFALYKLALVRRQVPTYRTLMALFRTNEPVRARALSKTGASSLAARTVRRWDSYENRYLAFVSFVAASWYVQPLLQRRLQLPFTGTRYPWAVAEGLTGAYVATYVLQVFSNFTALMYVDLFSLRCVILACSHFEALRNELQNLRDERRLVHLVRYHRRLLRISGLLDECLSPSLASQFAYNLTTMCFAIMALAQKETIDESVINVVCYLVLANIEIFIYCWFCHHLSDASLAITDGAYFSNWPDWTHKTKRNLQFFMFRSTKRTLLAAAGVFPVSVESYVTIVQTSFSYYTILRQLKGE